METTAMWSVQFWANGQMVGFSKYWGTKRDARSFGKKCQRRDTAIQGCEIRLIEIKNP